MATSQYSLPRADYSSITLWDHISTSIRVVYTVIFSAIFPYICPQPRLPKSPLTGKVAIVTGANIGIGYEIAKEMYLRGCVVILACRNEQRAKDARIRMLKETNTHDEDRLEIRQFDGSLLSNVRAFAQEWKKDNRKIDYLYLNAGIANAPQNTEPFTIEGLELVYVTNFLSTFLLTNLLLPHLNHQARIIHTSSLGAYFASFGGEVAPQSKAGNVERGFDLPAKRPWWLALLPFGSGTYEQSKAMQILFAMRLQRLLDESKRGDIVTFSVHPGVVAPNIFNALNLQGRITDVANVVFPLIGMTAQQGAQTALWLGLATDAKHMQAGGLHDRGDVLALPWFAKMNDSRVDALWQRWNNDAGLQASDWNMQ